MKPMVVLFALAAVACGSLLPAAQPPHYPAIVLGPDARPLDTAEVINARALHLQAKALEGSYAPLALGAIAGPWARSAIAPGLIGTPLLSGAAYGSSLLAPSALGYGGLGHYLKKRSLGHLTYASPAIAHVAPSAVSHQSRVDVISSPAVVSQAIAPVVAHAAPLVAAAPAISHQSRIDVRTSPALLAPAISPIIQAVPAYSNGYAGYGAYGAGAGLLQSHYLKKRSLGVAYASPAIAHAPSAVSHQSRVDIISSPSVVCHGYAAPVLAHPAPLIAAAPAVSHQSRIDVRTSPALLAPAISPIIQATPAYSTGYAAYGAYGAGAGLLRAAPLALGHAL